MPETPPPIPTLLLPLIPATGYCRSGKELHVRAGGQPPGDRCVKCGAASSSSPLITFSWHHPVIYLSILAGVLLYVILVLVLRQTVAFRVGLCPHHAVSRIVLAFVGGFVAAASIPSVKPLLFFMLPGLVFTILGSRLSRPLSTVVIRDGIGRFTGASPSYLESLPDRPVGL